MSETTHEHDEYGNCIIPPPNYRLEASDLFGIAVGATGAIFLVIGQHLQVTAREFLAHANYRRQERELREAQRAYEAHQQQMAAALERMTGIAGDDS